MFNRRSEIGSVLDKYNKHKKENTTLGCFLAACTSLGKNSAKLVVGSSSPIDINVAKTFTFKSTGHKLIPYGDSFDTYEDKGKGLFFASLLAYRNPVHQVSEEEGNSFIQMNANTFLDQDLGIVWEKADVEGTPCFLRKNEDNLDDILKNAMFTAATTEVRANTNIDSFASCPKEGQAVQFFTMTEGKPGLSVAAVKSATNTDVTIAFGPVEHTIPLHAVTSVIEIEAASSIDEVIEYLKKAYPDSYRVVLDKIKQGKV